MTGTNPAHQRARARVRPSARTAGGLCRVAAGPGTHRSARTLARSRLDRAAASAGARTSWLSPGRRPLRLSRAARSHAADSQVAHPGRGAGADRGPRRAGAGRPRSRVARSRIASASCRSKRSGRPSQSCRDRLPTSIRCCITSATRSCPTARSTIAPRRNWRAFAATWNGSGAAFTNRCARTCASCQTAAPCRTSSSPFAATAS